MRKLIVSMNVTLDGFMAGSSCELDWHFQSWTPEMAVSLCEQLSKADTILLGGITYVAMAGYWSTKMDGLSMPREDVAFAQMMNNHAKIVFSRSANKPRWNNSRFVTGPAGKEVFKLKQAPGKDMIIYGSGQLVSALMRDGLVDEYILWIHPVALSSGKPLFRDLHRRLHLQLTSFKTFSSGVVVLSYVPLRNNKDLTTGPLRAKYLSTT